MIATQVYPTQPQRLQPTRKKNRSGYSEYETRCGVKRFGNYGWVLRDVKSIPHITREKQSHSRYRSNHIPTYPHPLYPSGYQPSKLPNAKWESGIPAPQQHTIARITPLSFAYSASNRGGYIPLPPLLYTHPRSGTRAKETPSMRCVEITSRNTAYHHHPNGEYDVPIRGKFILLDLFCPEETQQNKTHPTIGLIAQTNRT